METVTLEKGALEPTGQQVIEEKLAVGLGKGALRLVEHEGTTAPSDEFGALGKLPHSLAADPSTDVEAQPIRYGYREDSSPEEIALLHQAQAGDTESFAELYRLHVRRVTGYVRKRMIDEDQDVIPDIVQDAFCEAFAELPNAHYDITGWFLTHAAKAYIRYARSRRQQERAVIATKDVVRREYAHGYARQHPGNITAIGHVMLVHALARLTPSQREVVQHRYLEGQTQAATAVILGKTLRAVRSNEWRALGRMREGLANTK